MSGCYPVFRSSYSHEELVEHFLLTPVELSLSLKCRGDANRCGMALLLKAGGFGTMERRVRLSIWIARIT